MAFALTLFVEAANRRMSTAVASRNILPQEDGDVCRLIYQTLCADLYSAPVAGSPPKNYKTTLYAAFETLCSHYDGDPLQVAVCARVLAFHFLMERTAGAALADWVQPHPETTELVTLNPAVIEAIATVKLRGSVQLSQDAFLKFVAEKAASSNREQVH